MFTTLHCLFNFNFAVFSKGFNISEANNGYTLITSDYGVTVFWNNVYNARVTIKGRYVNRTVGLCGNFNQMEDDDFWTSYGTIVNDAVEFGNSWKVDPSCANATEVMHPCMANSSRLSIAQANCSILFSPPFNSCASHINATARGYYDNCVYDMCACEDDPDVCYCQALDAYSADCAQYVSIHWRQLDQFAICSKSRLIVSKTCNKMLWHLQNTSVIVEASHYDLCRYELSSPCYSPL